MLKKCFFISSFVLALILSGCTIATGSQVIVTTAPQVESTLPPTTTPEVDATRLVPSSSSPTPLPSIPVTWSNLHLDGKLVFVANSISNNGMSSLMKVQELDLLTGGLTTIFQAMPDEWIDSAVVSPDHKQIIMAYSPTSLQQGATFTPLALYAIPIDGSQSPHQLFPLPLTDDQDFEPVWSPDGKYLYFVLVNTGLPPAEPNQHFPIYQIYRMSYPNGQPEKILDKAYWPRLSADGSRLVYVSENPDDMTNKLFVASADGGNPHQIVLTGTNVPTIIDAPFFLPDGKTILFSAPTPVQSLTIPWLDRLFGAIPASAHNIASEWWSVSVSGGAVTQLTHIQAPGLYGSISPDNQHIASFSASGIFVMNPNGTGLTMVVPDTGGILATVNWIP